MSSCLLNDKSVKKLMLGYTPDIRVGEYKCDFTTFNINPDYADEIEVYPHEIVLKKIIPNKYILKSKTDYATAVMKNLTNDVAFRMSGMDYLVEQGIVTNWKYSTWGGPDYTGAGFIYAPWWSWDESYAKSHPWELASYSKNHNVEICGAFKDGWFRINHNYSRSDKTFLGIAIYTGTALPEGQTFFDISEHPLRIKMLQNGTPLGPERAEIWDMYDSTGKNVYHKDKTVENCWKEYGYLNRIYRGNIYEFQEIGDINYDSDCVNIICGNDRCLPLPVDWKSYDNIHYTFKGCNPFNIEVWDEIKEYLSTHIFRSYTQYMFGQCNLPGKLVFHIGSFINSGEDVFFAAGDNMFEGTNDITEVEIHLHNTRLNGNRLFYKAYGLKDIKVVREGDSGIYCVNCAGMFSFCGLDNFPVDILAYNNRSEGQVGWSAYSYAFEYTHFPELPLRSSSSDRFADVNRMCPEYYSPQVFNFTQIVTIWPMIDMIYVDPKQSSRMFNSSSIVDARICNLNHGDWDFTGYETEKQGDLQNLNAESVKYLFDNLRDLNLCDGTYDVNDWRLGRIPKVNAATLKCPSQWEDKVTADMLTAAKAKNWTVYIGGTLKN